MRGYCTVDNIKNYNLTEIEESFVPQVEEWIGIAEAIVEKETGRVFIADTEDSDRIYDGIFCNSLLIDDCQSVSEVKIYHADGTLEFTLTEDDFVLSPYNSLPKTKIIIKLSSGATFLNGYGNVSVKAKWGYSATVPAAITFATMVIASGIMNNGNDAPGEKKSETIGDYSVTYKDDNGWNDLKKSYDIINTYKSPKMYV